MLHSFKRLPSPAMVVAGLALTLSFGGVGYAAATLPANSVGPKQLKKDAVTASDISKGAITPAKLHPTTLALLKSGASGPKGETGPQGPAGPAGTPAAKDVPTVRVYATKGALLKDSVPTAVAFDGEDYDAFGMHDPAAPSALTAPVTGTYLISAGLTFDAKAEGVRALLIAVPGTSGVQAVAPSLPGVGGYVSTSTQMRLLAGQKVEFRGYQNSGGPLAVLPQNTEPYTTVHAEMTLLAP